MTETTEIMLQKIVLNHLNWTLCSISFAGLGIALAGLGIAAFGFSNAWINFDTYYRRNLAKK
jgi:hypothetical protein